MATVAEVFALALQNHQAGELREAAQRYQQVLHADPNHADAVDLLGVIAYQEQRYDQATVAIQRALTLNPSCAAYYCHLALAQDALGQPEEALASFQTALRLRPDFPEAHNDFANLLATQGKLDLAAAHLQQAVRLRPDFAAAHNNLGNVLQRLAKPADAETHCREALRLRPGLAEVHNNLGSALESQGKLEAAVAQYRSALERRPDYPEAHNNLGNALLTQGNPEEAASHFQEALRLKPEYAAALANLGNVHKFQGRFDDALACYEQALRQDPDNAERHFNRALLWLLLGNWTLGWPEYEWRWRSKSFPRLDYQQPRWDGSSLAGRTLLVVAEQGLGDTLQFIRYVLLLQRRGEKVVVQCQPALIRLLAETLGADKVFAVGTSLPPYDIYAPLLSLPGILGTAPSSVPAEVPYLQATPRLIEKWRQELEQLKGLKVGIAWQGNPTFPSDRQRSIPLAQFAPLAKVPGAHLISLQKNPGSDQLAALARKLTVLDLGARLDDSSGAFMDTAAIMMSLDLVISSDTAVAHLAGALGMPVWVALSPVPDWRWLLERQDSPWYPTMRLFRQKQYGSWEEVFKRLAGALREAQEGQPNRGHHRGAARPGVAVP
jgi:tetratricopeptide (TPR) repeat protein